MRYLGKMQLFDRRSCVVHPAQRVRFMRRTFKLCTRANVAVRPLKYQVVEVDTERTTYFNMAVGNSLNYASHVSFAALSNNIAFVDESINLETRFVQVSGTSVVEDLYKARSAVTILRNIRAAH